MKSKKSEKRRRLSADDDDRWRRKTFACFSLLFSLFAQQHNQASQGELLVIIIMNVMFLRPLFLQKFSYFLEFERMLTKFLERMWLFIVCQIMFMWIAKFLQIKRWGFLTVSRCTCQICVTSVKELWMREGKRNCWNEIWRYFIKLWFFQ